MTNEINKINSKVDCQASKIPAGVNNVPQKQDAVTLSAGPSKIKGLKESKELLEMQKKLKQLLDGWAEDLEGDVVHDVYGPVDLKTGTNDEIIKKLKNEATTKLNIICGKNATEAFKDSANQYCSTEKADEKIREITELLKNPIFKRTVYVGEMASAYGGDGANDYLLGITKNNKMLGVCISYAE